MSRRRARKHREAESIRTPGALEEFAVRQLALTLEANRKKAQAEAATARFDLAHRVVDLFIGSGALKIGLALAALAAGIQGKLPLLG
jgi:methylase of polypeptide subunit release factors